MKITFIEKKHETGDAWSYYFDNPKDTHWVAGQYQRWELPIDANDVNDKEHWFTISAAPSEKYFRITTRNTSSNFKSNLHSLKQGETIVVDTLEGDFVWHDNNKSKAFIAGGIGITPFRSMLIERHISKLPINVHLLFAGRDDDFVFKKELDMLAIEHHEFQVTYLTGMLTKDVITREISDLKDRQVYLSGPEQMVEIIGKELIVDGLPETQLKQDWFPGYDSTNY